MTEREYRDYIYEKAKKVKTKEELDELLNEVVNETTFDYGTIVYAICGCMKATMNYVNRSKVGGITGFQASFIPWEMISEYMMVDDSCGLRLVQFSKMLYPQFKHRFEKTISSDTWNLLQTQAKKELVNNPKAHKDVIKHWKSIVDGKVPFGYKIKD